MQYSTVALATLIIIFSVYTLFVSIKNSDKQIRLVYMKNKLGKFWGNFFHTLIYIIIPVIFGSFMLNAGMNGETIVSFITEK